MGGLLLGVKRFGVFNSDANKAEYTLSKEWERVQGSDNVLGSLAFLDELGWEKGKGV